MSTPQNPEHDPVELTENVDGVPAGTVCQVTHALIGGHIVAEATVENKPRQLALGPHQYTYGATKPLSIEHEMLQPA